MSGILGIISTDGESVDFDRLKAMSSALAHRGPDDENWWQGDGAGFGHRMLRTTPESKIETLPYHDLTTGLVITSDSRLDNRDELLDIFEPNSFPIEVIPDSWIILQAYLKWQEDCHRHLLGDFSFAIWNIRKKNLFCARDHLGIKPFYYYCESGNFIFCSESWVIAHHSGVPITIHEPRIADHFTPHLEGLDKTSTFYNGIHRLPPAHLLHVRQGHLSISQYWQPQPSCINTLKTDQDYLDELKEIITRAVTVRCRGIDNPSVLLSGGVDSATIMGITRRLYRDKPGTNVHTFSGVSENVTTCKESQMIAILSGSGGITPHIYSPTDLDERADALFSILTKLQEPFDISMVLTFLLYQQTAENGGRVVLDGVDGDIITSLSPDYPVKLFGSESFKRIFQETTAQSRNYYDGTYSPSKLFLRHLLSAYTPRFVKQWRWRTRLPEILNTQLSHTGLDDVFIRRVKLRKRLMQFEEENRERYPAFPQESYLLGVQHPFLTVGIERYDKVASLCSVEPRHPLLDKRIVDFYSGLPWNQFVRDGLSKFVLRQVGQQYVPQEICWRTGNEHVGYQFTDQILQLKEKEILSMIANHAGLLRIILKSKFAFHCARDYNDSKSMRPKYLHNNIVGLALWLKENSKLRKSDAPPCCSREEKKQKRKEGI